MTQAYRWLIVRHFEKTAHPLGTRIPRPLIARPYVKVWNFLDRVQVRLSEAGKAHAGRARQALGRYLASEGIRPAYAYISPYRRTRESFQELFPSLPLGLIATYDRRLGELNGGVRCGGDFGETCRRYPWYGAAVERAGFLGAAAPYGESHASRRDGGMRAFVEELKQVPGDCLVVTHCGVIDCLHQIASGMTDDAVVLRLADPDRTRCGSVLDLRYAPGDGVLSMVRENVDVLEPPG